MFYRSVQLVIVSTLLSSLAIVAVALRFWDTRAKRAAITADDYLITFGLILSLGLYACNIVAALNPKFGNHEILIMGGPIGEWPIAWLWLLLGYEKLYFALQLLHTTAMSVIKLSLILLLSRIFGSNHLLRVSLWIMGAYLCIWWFVAFGLGVFQSWSLASNWDPDRGMITQHLERDMLKYFTWYAWLVLLNVVSDVAVVLLPIPMVLRLQEPMKFKAISLVVFTTASLAIAAGIARTSSYFSFNHRSPVVSYSFFYFIIWTAAEPCLAIVGCCLATLGSLYHGNSDRSYHKLESSSSKRSLEDAMTAIPTTGQDDTWSAQCNACETNSEPRHSPL